jgi:hypothetical protein
VEVLRALDQPNRRFFESSLISIVEELPAEWYEDSYDEVQTLCCRLLEHRRKVRELIAAFRHCSPRPFPNWAG